MTVVLTGLLSARQLTTCEQPFFLLLTFGYKLIKQTKMIRLEDMTFYRGRKRGEDSEEDAPNGYLERFLTWLLII